MPKEFVPVVTEEHVRIKKIAADRVRRRALSHKLEHVVDGIGSLTGTLEGHEDPRRLALSMGIMVGATVAAAFIPDQPTAMLASDAIGALGGAFIGENIAPVSRSIRFKRKRFIKNIGVLPDAAFDAQLVPFLSTYKDVLREDEIKSRLLGRIPSLEQKPVADARYLVVDRLAKRHKQNYQGLRSGKNAREYRESQRQYVINSLMEAQLNSHILRANGALIRKEGTAKVMDIVSGVVVVALFSEIINQALNAPAGGLVGLIDDVALFAAILGSIAIRNLSELKLKTDSGTSRSNTSHPSRTHVADLTAVHQHDRDDRENTGRDRNQSCRR